MDKLEKFILDNKEEMDMFEPNENIWEKIEKREKQTKIRKINWKSVLSKAAAILIIFSLSFLLQEYLHYGNKNELVDVKDNNQISAEIQIPELVEAEIYYSVEVEKKMGEVMKFTKSYPDLKTELEIDMAELDSIYNELKNDLKDNADNEEVVNAMIQNYRIKLQILEDILIQLQRMNNEKKTKEKTTVTL